ncbi:MAG: immune inhibitor A, partial [Candidatus Eisenbacteria sp.]|nr:immune inhibitor A [Candidatus Eisenbacteria bacterium]
NAGWLSLDRSGTLEQVNYWHKDTIRINGFEHLGDSTWWCGTYNDCWRQPRGYGNDWLCLLVRELPLSDWSSPGDDVDFEWDQRLAMENDYDYGYVDVLPEGDSEWMTLATFDNPGFAGTPGSSTDWDHETYGHWSLDMSAYAGVDVEVRFRLESDGANSSQDMPDSSPMHPFRDGAWQLDNFSVTVNDTVRWFDDCESAGSNGWVHDNIPASGQTGVLFERVFNPDMLRPSWCGWPRNHWWMAALDSLSGTTVNGENAWLISPPIDISGATTLIGQWEAWYDCPRPSEDRIQLWLAAGDSEECVQDPVGFVYSWFLPLDGAYWNRWTDDWSNFAGPDWFAINWRLRN